MMPDVEKVLEALRHCLPTTKEDGLLTCDTCPYYRCDDGVRLSVSLVEDIRELLKEQQKKIEEMNFIYGFVYGGQVKELKKLIRCRECKHCFVDGDGVRYNVCELNHNKVQADDWFCADGEERSE